MVDSAAAASICAAVSTIRYVVPVIVVSSSSSCLCSATVSVKVSGNVSPSPSVVATLSASSSEPALASVTSASIAAGVSTTVKCPFPEKRSLCSTVRTTSTPE